MRHDIGPRLLALQLRDSLSYPRSIHVSVWRFSGSADRPIARLEAALARLTPDQIAEIDKRTTDIGLYNFAEAYLLSAKTLTSQKIPGLRFADPIEYLFYHSIELFLKSYLRNRGLSAYILATQYSHNLVKLRDEAAALGLHLDQKENARIDHLQNEGLVIEARYIKTGFKQPIPLEALLGTAERVRDRVLHELTQVGLPLRSGPFYPGITFDTSHRTFPEVGEDT
jgi:hypothetical protein